jgi:hypothetical protein
VESDEAAEREADDDEAAEPVGVRDRPEVGDTRRERRRHERAVRLPDATEVEPDGVVAGRDGALAATLVPPTLVAPEAVIKKQPALASASWWTTATDWLLRR